MNDEAARRTCARLLAWPVTHVCAITRDKVGSQSLTLHVKIPHVFLVSALAGALMPLSAAAQTTPFPRIPASVLDVTSPTERVRGETGRMIVRQVGCRMLPTAATRRRIVDIAVQEWGFFGFRIAQPQDDEGDRAGGDASPGGNAAQASGRRRGRSRLPPEEALRVARSIAGYWAVTPEGTWIVARQNDAWNGEVGIASRWEYPWSAAFISWVMCEAGLGEPRQFQRAVGHHSYLDQAIRARDGVAPYAAFTAYDAGEATIEPGDLLCTARRPVYRTIAERRRQSGVGARTHCDIVVQVDDTTQRLLVIGGNVRGVVALKLLAAARGPRGLRPLDRSDNPRARPVFAHLKLGAASIGTRALDSSATIKAIGCAAGAGAGPFIQRAAAPASVLAPVVPAGLLPLPC
jgi:hypothetical protein